MDISLKLTLHQKCIEIIDNQLNGIEQSIQEAQDAANNETKSSAGDKHEIGRAMAQLETEKLTSQLTSSLKLKETLSRINPKIINQQIGLGSFIKTNHGLFYLSIGLGKIIINQTEIIVISHISPLGKIFINKKEKESFSFHNTNYLIEKII